MPDKPHLTFNLESTLLGQKLESKTPKIKLEAQREAALSRRSCHNHTNFLIFSKFTQKAVSVYVHRGQFFTNYNKLSELWNCSKEQARYQVEKWLKDKTINIKRVKDDKGFDLGLLITYNWLYNHTNTPKKKYKPKIPTRETAYKAHTQGTKKSNQNSSPTHKEEVLPKGNIHASVLFKEFRKLKLNKKYYPKLINDFGKDTIWDYLKLLEMNKNITNPAGWLVQALYQKYDLQKVENWKKEEQKQTQLEIQQKQIEIEQINQLEKKEQERQEKNQLIEEWKSKNGQQIEDELFLEAFNYLAKNNKIIYKHLLKKKKPHQDLIEFLQTDLYVNSMVKNRVLSLINKN